MIGFKTNTITWAYCMPLSLTKMITHGHGPSELGHFGLWLLKSNTTAQAYCMPLSLASIITRALHMPRSKCIGSLGLCIMIMEVKSKFYDYVFGKMYLKYLLKQILKK